MKRRCAIYTRKSTEEGLEQAFNSLDAQREACAAYVLSQAHEGWEQVNEHYDDGGWSGGNMARPGLQQLLADVAAGKVDVIVVYKVDRLTRSLADFARIVEALDKAGASFVSVTQAFNTTTSMGRLTLNVLLSFAQFELEVTSERIRDKIAASKRKGMWMGGSVPIGYRVSDRKLVIVESEAATVRHIFERYLHLKSTTALANELAASGVRSKVRTFSDGTTRGGCVFSVGSLSQLLKDPLFAGKIKHHGELFDGQHQAIIQPDAWEEVQVTLKSNNRSRLLGERARSPSLLTGMIIDPDGRPMSPVFTTKGVQQHRYYVTRLRPGQPKSNIWRVPARAIERAVLHCVDEFLSVSLPISESKIESFLNSPTSQQRGVLVQHEITVQLTSSTLKLRFGQSHYREIAMKPVRKGRELKIVLKQGGEPRQTDLSLFRLVTYAIAARQSVLTGVPEGLLSRYTSRHLYKLLRLSWVAPDIITAIVEGRQPAHLTSKKLLRVGDVPIEWEAQRRFFGFN